MSKTFTLDEVNALELSAADNATILERERIIKLLEDEISKIQETIAKVSDDLYSVWSYESDIALLMKIIDKIKGEQE